MKTTNYLKILFLSLSSFWACQNPSNQTSATASEQATSSMEVDSSEPFPSELVDFVPISENPIFTGSGDGHWDEHIRERGFILKEGDLYRMWYTGFKSERQSLQLGYATSTDGISWTRYEGNSIFDESWTEDMMVLKVNGTYQMFAEGKGDIAHRMSSADGIHWTDHGSLDIRQVNGDPLSEGPYGTPTVWYENDLWYLFYERGDLGIWLATSTDLQTWTNVQDPPVIEMGPTTYDLYGLAVNQIVKHKGWYYAYFHGTPDEDWSTWSTNVAASKDLIHWTKYPNNPLVQGNKSSGIVVPDGDAFRLYTMHDKVELHYNKK